MFRSARREGRNAGTEVGETDEGTGSKIYRSWALPVKVVKACEMCLVGDVCYLRSRRGSHHGGAKKDPRPEGTTFGGYTIGC